MNDDGFTSLPGGLRLRKSDLLFCALGSLDELNAALGILRAQIIGTPDAVLIESFQRELFSIGGELATGKPQLKADSIATLERETKKRGKGLPPLCDFVVPGKTELSGRAHWARAVCRRAERDLIRAQDQHPERVSAVALTYLNRLSGLLFILARVQD
jgi:cob(I)alamin adenosyltransferase